MNREIERPKLLVLGYAGHGKDTVCEILRDVYGYSFQSSSEAALHEVVYPALKDKYGYTSPEECWADKNNRREEWYRVITEYNNPDKARLAKKIYEKNDIYCGLRNIDEYHEIAKAGLFDLVIWVDAFGRLGTRESEESCTVHSGLADLILINNGSINFLKNQIYFFQFNWRELLGI